MDDDAPDEELMGLIAAFCRLGYDELVALKLAWEGASPSEVRELIRHGCPSDVATQIVL